MTPGRRLAVVVTADAIGAALLLAAAGRTWFTARDRQVRPLPDIVDTFSGADLSAVRAVGLVALAGVLALVAAPAVLRAVVAAGLALAGTLAAVDVAGVLRAPVVAAAQASPVAVVHAHDGGPGDVTAWAWVGLAGAVLVAAAGLLGLVWSRSLPALSARYARDRPAGTARPADREQSLWEALDAGTDPTAEESPGPPRQEGPEGDAGPAGQGRTT